MKHVLRITLNDKATIYETPMESLGLVSLKEKRQLEMLS